MTLIIYTGNNKLNLSSNRTNFSDLSLTLQFLSDISLMKIALRTKWIPRMRLGKSKTKCSSHGFNQHCRNRFSLESLARFTRIKSGIKFISTSICRQRRVPANFALTFAPPPLTARRCVSSYRRSRTLLTNSHTSTIRSRRRRSEEEEEEQAKNKARGK